MCNFVIVFVAVQVRKNVIEIDNEGGVLREALVARMTALEERHQTAMSEIQRIGLQSSRSNASGSEGGGHIGHQRESRRDRDYSREGFGGEDSSEGIGGNRRVVGWRGGVEDKASAGMRSGERGREVVGSEDVGKGRGGGGVTLRAGKW